METFAFVSSKFFATCNRCSKLPQIGLKSVEVFMVRIIHVLGVCCVCSLRCSVAVNHSGFIFLFSLLNTSLNPMNNSTTCHANAGYNISWALRCIKMSHLTSISVSPLLCLLIEENGSVFTCRGKPLSTYVHPSTSVYH